MNPDASEFKPVAAGSEGKNFLIETIMRYIKKSSANQTCLVKAEEEVKILPEEVKDLLVQFHLTGMFFISYELLLDMFCSYI